ncbi:MAG: class I SAM-dependent methyltransferase [Chlamydiota bacterium]|nr:class I SAM-dependent methyltransferase [Chlamydiota bacterium]
MVYNLGCLTRGDHSITTLSSMMIVSLQSALRLLPWGGMLSLMAHPGHPEGWEKTRDVDRLSTPLDPSHYCTSSASRLHSPHAPVGGWIKKSVRPF